LFEDKAKKRQSNITVKLEDEHDDDEVERALEDEEDDEIIKNIRKQNHPKCFCFKRKVKKELQEQVLGQLVKSVRFKQKIEDEDLDIERIINAGKDNQKT